MSGVALVHHSYGPYHLARTQRLQPLLHEPLHLVELAAHEQLRDWARPVGAQVRTAVTGTLESAAASTVARGLRAILDEVQPHTVVIAGYAHPAMRAAASWARGHRAAAILLSDSHHQDKRRQRLKEAAKALFIRAHFDAAFTSGAAATSYLQGLGVAPERIWRGYDVVDNELFGQLAEQARNDDARIRAELNLPEQFLLYVGRFAPEKNLPGLLAAYRQFRDDSGAGASSLVLAGSGPEEARIRTEVRRLQLERFVRLPGFFQQTELGRAYGLARALLLPSKAEPWGLVVNEAMAAGLPAVVSTRCGCGPDLVFPGVNGFILSPDDTGAWAIAMRRLDADAALRARMGAESRRIISPWSLDRWAHALADCVHAVRRRG